MDCLKTEKGVRSKIHIGGVYVPFVPPFSFFLFLYLTCFPVRIQEEINFPQARGKLLTVCTLSIYLSMAWLGLDRRTDHSNQIKSISPHAFLPFEHPLNTPDRPASVSSIFDDDDDDTLDSVPLKS